MAWRELELPTFKGKPGWEFTELADFDLASYPKPGPGAPGALDAAGEARLVFPADAVDGVRLTQVDAVSSGLDPAHPALPDGAIVMPLTQAAAEHGELVDAHLGSLVSAGENAFVARNAAEWEGGAFVYIPRGVAVQAPIVLSAIQAQAGTVLNWRALVVLEEGAEAEVWEQYGSTQPGLFTTVVELVVGQGASLRFVTAQDLDEGSQVFGTQRAKVARDGTLDWVVLGFGGATGKVFQNTILDGQGAEGKVTGAYALTGRQHLDFDTTQEHAAPRCTSDLAFRGILAGRSSAVWRGMIKVDEGAQQTDAFQESRNLLVSKRAHADAIPGLEILANDVRCTHAAAVAQIDPEQLFYLRAHGLPLGVASRLVIEGFLAELVERFEAGAVREALASALERRLATVLG
ncbi:MAG TPA: Fe-S cluster assembly protein SufD [Solirubrobacteraceae bacterium]|nr:Fe-S cluster assembly protein SufD [Solirubrobacteraceae bacterium]